MTNVLNKEVEIIVFDINSEKLRSMENQNTFLDLDEALNSREERQISKSSEDESDIDITSELWKNIHPASTWRQNWRWFW